jgi:hypothetical protein
VKTHQTAHLYVNKYKIWNSTEFEEMWQIDYPEISLSTRRPQQNWGWLNQCFF